MKPLTDIERAANDIYMLFREYNGSIKAVSDNLRNKDASKFSRQISVSDDRRDNPFIEVLEILTLGTLPFSAELAQSVWRILEREWCKNQKNNCEIEAQLTELLGKIFDELRDVSTINFKNTSQSKLEKESYELLAAARCLYEKVKQWKDE